MRLYCTAIRHFLDCHGIISSLRKKAYVEGNRLECGPH